MKRQVSIDESLFKWPADQPRLIGAECSQCGVVTFPKQRGCPRCGHETMRERLLARRGTLWTWTTQGYLPKEPYRGPGTKDVFEPYAIGYVELPDGLRVEARLTESDPSRLRIGMEMELVVVSLYRDADGNDVLVHAFRPVEQSIL